MRKLGLMPLFERQMSRLSPEHSKKMVRCLQLLKVARNKISSTETFQVTQATEIHEGATAIEFGVGEDIGVVTIVVVFEEDTIGLIGGYQGALSDIPITEFATLSDEINRAITAMNVDLKPPRMQP